ncbi:hypothetical protein GCM10011365_09390 [Marinicella pacifica]|uniref:Uncharacterized protein n=1 Tax=Marinicella pacifica TaxID=1171543 RepID=A0A917FL61_9GAMM|nr:hypothetical protein GCM10011365_09390 [Marinicella pacifica]
MNRFQAYFWFVIINMDSSIEYNYHRAFGLYVQTKKCTDVHHMPDEGPIKQSIQLKGYRC